MTALSRPIAFGALVVELSSSHVRPLLKLAMLFWLAVWGLRTPASCQTTYTWTDADYKTAGSQLWSDASNWNPNGVPGQICTSCSVSIGPVNHPGYTTFPIQNVNLSLQNMAIDNTTKVAIQAGNSLTLTGSMLSGNVQMVFGGGLNLTTLNINSGVTFAGGGALGGLVMENNSQILGNGTLTNNGTISYGSVAGSPAGVIGNGSLTLVNNSLVTAGGSSSVLDLCPKASWQNAGTLQAISGGTLNINCYGTIAQLGAGQISADGSTVILGTPAFTPKIVGGVLASNGGHFTACSVFLSNLTNAAVFQVNCPSSGVAASTYPSGTITNNGQIQLLSPTGALSEVIIDQPTTLAGAGSIELIAGSKGKITNILSSGPTLTNQQYHTITGQGSITANPLVNQGTILAAAGNGLSTLTVTPGSGGLTNSGNMSADPSSTLEIYGGDVNNVGGTLSAGSGTLLLDGNVAVFGGTVDGASGVAEGKAVLLDATSNPITLDGQLNINGGEQTNVQGAFSGTGTFYLNASSTTPATLFFKSGATTLGSGVSVVLGQDQPLNTVNGDGSTGTTASKVTFNGTFEGNGVVENIRAIFPAKSKVQCLLNGTPLKFESTATFSGTLSNPTGCTIEADVNPTNYVPSTNTWNGGTLNLSGPFKIPSGDSIVNLGGHVNFVTPAGLFQTVGGIDALSPSLKNIGKAGGVALAPTQVFQVPGPLTSSGAVTVPNQAYFDVLSGDFSVTGGTVVLNGKVNLPAGRSLIATGGTVEGNAGIINGNFAVGNASGGATVYLNLGPKKNVPGQLFVYDALSLLATVNLNVPITGTGHGLLTVTGKANLGGTLTIARNLSYTPPLGTTDDIIDAAGGVTGTFKSVIGTAINNNEHWEVDLSDPNAVRLKVVPGP